MGSHSTFVSFLVIGLMFAGSSIAVHASDSDGATALVTPPLLRIRTNDPQLRILIADAIQSSAIVRTLADRISVSDVVVYLACERDPNVRGPGRLNFMVHAGGVRYVVIRLKPTRRDIAIAMLAHELQHAVEIAETPSIVDDESLARAYMRMGYRSHTAHGGLAFDTKAAVETGRRVKEELNIRPSANRVWPVEDD